MWFAAVANGNVTALLHFDGTNGSTTFTDELGSTWTRTGTPTISTAQSVFGGSSFNAQAPTNLSVQNISTPSADGNTFGSGDFTIEWRARFASVTLGQTMVSKRLSRTVAGAFSVGVVSGTVAVFMSSDGVTSDIVLATGVTAVSANTWYAFALVRNGNNFYLYKDGSRNSLGTSSASLYSNASHTLNIGGDPDGACLLTDGYIDEFRITKGAALYTGATYSVASSPFPNP